MARTGQAALNWCAAQVAHPSQDWHNWCLVFSRMAFGVGPKYPDASQGWYNATYKHPGTATPPAAVPVWWTGGSQGHGHVAVSDGNGYCYSSDILRYGKIDRVPIALINQKWGLPYKGWTEDINGVRVYSLPPQFPSLPAVDWSNVRDASMRTLPPQTPDVLRVEKALEAEGLLPSAPAGGYTGVIWRQGYAGWQKRCGVPGPYDGIPGMKSLTLLGQKYKFRVVP